MGPKVSLELDRCGFYPAGGGRFRAIVEPASAIAPIDLRERGEILRKKARALVSCLPENIGHREMKVVRDKGMADPGCLRVECADGPGPGNVVMIEIECAEVRELFSGFGQRGVSAENVAREAVSEAREYIASGAPVGKHLADQLLIPLALAGSGSFVTVEPTMHLTTNAQVIGMFLDARIETADLGDGKWEIAARRRAAE